MSTAGCQQHFENNFIADPWIANSLMQKAIRRGEVEIAQWAAASFHLLRGSSIWRRLMIIAFEDIGIGSVETVIATVRACSDIAYRRANGGNARVIADVVAQLATAEKDRSADHLIAAGAEHPSLEMTRRQMAALDAGGRLQRVIDANPPLPMRAVAAWYASGLQWNREQRMCGGDLDGLLAAYREIGIVDDLTSAVALAARRTREPFTVLLPLIWLAARESGAGLQTEATLFPPTGFIEGIPLYAFDLHTRLGRQALDVFRQESRDIRAVLVRYAPERSGLEAVRLAAFHVEAALVDPLYPWQLGRKIEALGIETDLLGAGLVREGHAAMLDAVRRNLDHLNDLRQRAYRRSGLRLCR